MKNSVAPTTSQKPSITASRESSAQLYPVNKNHHLTTILHLITTFQPHFLHVFSPKNQLFGSKSAWETSHQTETNRELPKTHHNSPQKPKIGFIHSKMV
jgi:hypothetical protein